MTYILHLTIKIARQLLQVGKPAQRTGLATRTKPASAGSKGLTLR
ncbi:hypothetical protein [Nostoc sp. FACHB-280]|nr:hypothetical protein [Nostoc sp. FACHB-280]